MAYADLTTNDPHHLKRWVHRRRLASALSLVEPRGTVLDFGGGNGELCKHLATTPEIKVICYEPSSQLYAEAAANLSNSNVLLIRNLDGVPKRSVDLVYCNEVFEHLPEKESVEACLRIRQLLRPNGLAVVGVPIEIGPVALFKGLFRMTRRYGSHDAIIGHVLLATLGRPPARLLSVVEPGLPYFFHHLGFDHRKLATLLSKHFVIEKVVCSPFHRLGPWANSEMYFKAKAREA